MEYKYVNIRYIVTEKEITVLYFTVCHFCFMVYLKCCNICIAHMFHTGPKSLFALENLSKRSRYKTLNKFF